MYGIVVGADTGKPFGQFAEQAPAEQSGYVGDVIAACKVWYVCILLLPAIAEALGSAVFVVVDNPVKTGGIVGMRIQKICLDLQFPFVCPEVIALADGDILSPTLGVGLYEVLLQSQIFLPVE